MTQPTTPPPLGIDDAYLYGAWIEDVRFDAWDLRVAVVYDDQLSEFFELEPRLNLRACTVVFRTVRNPPEVEAFRRQWEAADKEWSLSAVAADPAGGYWLATREGGEITVDCEACLLEDVDLVPGDAAAWPLPHNAELFPDARRYLGGEPIRMFDEPEPRDRKPGQSHRTGATGYILLAAGLLGLTWVAVAVLQESDLGRARELPTFAFSASLSLGCIIAGVRLLRRGPRKSDDLRLARAHPDSRNRHCR